MNFIHYITAILMSLEPSYGDRESWTERAERMEVLAQAIDDAASRATCSGEYADVECKRTWAKDKKSLAVLLVTTGYWESHFAKNIHEGKCGAHECDAHRINNVVYHRARSPWQVQKTGMVSNAEYKKMNSSSLESTTISANVATRYITSAMAECNTVNGTLAIYTGIRNCTWGGTRNRAWFYENLMKKTETQLEAAAAKQRKKLEARIRTKKENAEEKG